METFSLPVFFSLTYATLFSLGLISYVMLLNWIKDIDTQTTELHTNITSMLTTTTYILAGVQSIITVLLFFRNKWAYILELILLGLILLSQIYAAITFPQVMSFGMRGMTIFAIGIIIFIFSKKHFWK